MVPLVTLVRATVLELDLNRGSKSHPVASETGAGSILTTDSNSAPQKPLDTDSAESKVFVFSTRIPQINYNSCVFGEFRLFQNFFKKRVFLGKIGQETR